jgi:phosphatidylethanolamine-binding protein (PEBP) family uncharacterized protein
MKKYLSALTAVIMITAVLSACSIKSAAVNTKFEAKQASSLASTTAQSSEGRSASSSKSLLKDSKFVLLSPEVTEGGMLPKEYTCDGASATLPLEWSGAPAGAKSLAVVMHTVPKANESHWYWVLYNIPPEVKSLVKNVTGIGTLGNNSVNGRLGYSPPCSKGPGPKLYTYTVYALSGPPQLSVPPSGVSRDVLLSAIKDITLGSAELNVYYSR